MFKVDPRKLVGPAMALVLFAFAIRLLISEAGKISREEFMGGLTSIEPAYLVIAAFLIALNYGLLTCYDLLALRYVCRVLPLRRVALVAFLGYSLGNNLGTLIAAAPIRYRFYHRWGLTHTQIVALMSVLALTFWSGVCVLGGIALTLAPIELPAKYALPFGTRTLGIILLSVTCFYGLVCLFWHKPWPIGKLHLRPPSVGLASVQAAVAAVDLLISATALYLVMPGYAVVPFPMVLAAYLVAIVVSLISQVPGGLGVLELILWTLLKDTVGQPVLASVLIFRILYYILPLFVGMIVLVGHEIYAGAIEAQTDAKIERSRPPEPPRPKNPDPPFIDAS
ncbi:UPF0104 family protein [Rhodopirellula sp. ICT_H3.1]|uniref:UPF0104 family protein n=2 Tax=Aporhodopirellula aestuarii TaxID=2950107 RepID=A0ABT0TXK3_9BACT|nr:UPF0104 family protein [Aporhodopirellula aestuarii]